MAEQRQRGKIRFVRIRGRVVPIRSKKQKLDVQQGAALLGGGLVLTAAGSLEAGRSVKKADAIGEQVINFFKEKKGSKLPKGIKSVEEGLFKSRIKFEKANFRFKGIKLAGAAGIGLGISKLIKASGIEEGLGTEFLAETAGFGSGFAAESFFRKGIGEGFKTQFKKRKKKGFRIPKAFIRKKEGVIKRLAVKLLKKKFKLKF